MGQIVVSGNVNFLMEIAFDEYERTERTESLNGNYVRQFVTDITNGYFERTFRTVSFNGH